VAVRRRRERGNRWQARLLGANGRTISELFDRKVDVERWYGEQLSARERGSWMDPQDGKTTLAQFYVDWA
jgi:hypothetical protein